MTDIAALGTVAALHGDMLRRRAPYALLLASLLTTGSALASDVPSASAVGDQPSWPQDCTRGIELDGLVLLSSSLGPVSVSLRPSSETEDLQGAFGADRGTVRVWQSSQPLSPQTEYRLEVQPLDASGAAVGESQVSHFTTGDQLAAPLTLTAAPAARVLPYTAAANDVSMFSAESLRDDVVVVRVAVPGLSGGLSHRALQLDATLLGDTSSEEALGARVHDTQRAAPNQPIAFQLQAVLADEPSRRCLQIGATDDQGETTLTPEFCVELPARTLSAEAEEDAESAPYQLPQASQARALSGQGSELSLAAAQASAGGCSLGSGNPTRDVSWFLLAMLPFLAARRARLSAARA